MKKKFTVHLDALLMIAALFVLSLGLNIFLYVQFDLLSRDNEKQQWQALENRLNLDSQATYIKKLQNQLDKIKVD